MERILTVGQKSPSQVAKASRVNFFGLTLQIYQSRDRTATRLT